MSDVKKDSAGEIDRASSIAFFLSGESFLKTTIYAHETTKTKKLKLRLEMPIYYLY